MKIFLALTLIFLSLFTEAARIRNHKVKEAPRSCGLMSEDALLSRKDKRVVGTLRDSVVIESSEDSKSVTLIKDKGEKLCQWKLEDWDSIRNRNAIPDMASFKFHIDEYKEILYPYVKKADGSYFMMSIPFATCDLTQQLTTEKLELPKCEVSKKSKSRKTKKKKKKASTTQAVTK